MTTIQENATLAELQRIRQAFDLSAIVSETDARGVITYVNDTFVKVSGYSHEELLGKTHHIINSGYHPKGFFANMWQTILSGKSWRGEICNRAKDGTLYWVDSFIHPIQNEEGKITKFLSVRYLITEKKQIEQEHQRFLEQLKQRNQELENFVYVLVHNFRSPLTNILGLLQIIEERESLSAFNQNILSLMEKQAKELDSMIADLNQLLQLQRVIGSLPQETIYLKDLLTKVQNLLAKESQETNAHWEIDITNCPTITSVTSYLESILFNLFSNALKYHRPATPPHIKFTAQKTAEHYRLTVEDNGIGMELGNNPEYIFALYKRLNTEKEGKGMGLYLVKQQVTSLGGTITVESQPEKGSIFTVTLPLQKSFN